MTGKHSAVRLRSVALALGIATTIALLATAGLSEAQPSEMQERGSESPNVRVTFEAGNGSGEGRDDATRTMSFVLRANGMVRDFETGARVPIPATSFNASDASGAGIVPVTSYTYQVVGLSAVVAARLLADGRVALEGHLSDSQVRKNASGDVPRHPAIEVSRQEIDVALTDGETLRTLSIGDDGGIFFELSVEVLD